MVGREHRAIISKDLFSIGNSCAIQIPNIPISLALTPSQLEKDNTSSDPSNPTNANLTLRRSENCCVTFTDAPADLERALTSGNSQNCCVTFRKSSTATEALKRQKRREWIIISGVAAFAFGLMLMLIVSTGSRARPRGGLRDGE